MSKSGSANRDQKSHGEHKTRGDGSAADSRRGFLKKSAASLVTLAAGVRLLSANNLLSLTEDVKGDIQELSIAGKHPRLVLLNDRPLNLETPADLLDDNITPADRFFVRNNGIPPTEINVSDWRLTIEGESAITPKSYSIEDLKQKFVSHTYQLTIECGGNGRAEFDPPAKGNQWTTGAVGAPEWTGVRLKDLLEDVGIKDDAVYIGYYGADTHLSNDPDKVVISRGVPLQKAMEEETLVAWAMNGKDMPVNNGHPLRLVVGGWPGSVSGKWLTRIVIRNKVHDGPKMGGQSYRVPCKPVAPGEVVPDEDMCIIQRMPVKSLITYPRSGAIIGPGRSLSIRGHAWAGDMKVTDVHYSIDFGVSWNKCRLELPKNKGAWQQWKAEVAFPGTGYYEVWARATDSTGRSQPMLVPGWNPKGYLNNACHRIAVKVQ